MIKLIAATTPTESVSPLSSPQRWWSDRTAAYPLPGRLSFLVFEIECDFDLQDVLVGLHFVPLETSYVVAGTVDELREAIKLHKTTDCPNVAERIYSYIEQKLRDFGYDVGTT